MSKRTVRTAMTQYLAGGGGDKRENHNMAPIMVMVGVKVRVDPQKNTIP